MSIYSFIVEDVVVLIITVALAVYLVVKKRKKRFEISVVTLMVLKYASILVLNVYLVTVKTVKTRSKIVLLIFSSMFLASGLIAHLIYAS